MLTPRVFRLPLHLPSFARCLLPRLCLIVAGASGMHAQVTTPGFLNQPRTEAPGTLLSHPFTNGSESIGRTTSINYLNGWIIVGGEAPGSRDGSDLVLRVYDIADPLNPVRRLPSDFNLNYAHNWWHQGNVGWNAHGTAQVGDLLLPQVMRVASFGGPVELGGTNGIPHLGQMGVGYIRPSQAGPWIASMQWYGHTESPFTIERVGRDQNGYNTFHTIGSFDHVGPFGGGDWHPMFFGDLLVYARSGTAGSDGVVVYRLQYQADPVTDVLTNVTPHYVGSLEGGFQGYWPVLFSDGDGLHVVGAFTNILLAADITHAADPARAAAHPSAAPVRLAANLVVPGFTNSSYPVFQDNHAFIHNRKIDMTRLVAGDANPIVLTLNEGNPTRPPGAPAIPSPGVNTSQMSLVLGNLWLTGGYPHHHGTANYQAQGLGVWVHQQAPDTTRPRVAYHIPQRNRTGYPRHAPLSFLVHEHGRRGGPRNGIDFTVRAVTPGVGGAPDTLGAPVTGYLIHDFSGVLTFTPQPALAADTTYQVDFLANDNGTPANPDDDIGFQDTAGNLIEPYSFRFSTGGAVNATPPPAFASLTATTHQPAPGQAITVTAAAAGDGPFSYRFSFDGTWSEWSDTPAASHTYSSPGRPRVLVQIRDAHGAIVTQSLRILVIAPPVGPAPVHSSTLVIGDDPDGRRLWVVNPDANTVSVLDPTTGAKLAEHPVGQNPRSIARDAFGRYWVTCHTSDELRVLDPDGSTAHTLPLAYGSAPFGVVASPDGQSVFVSLQGSARIQRYSAANPSAVPVTQTTVPTPRALALTGDGQRLFVTRFISPDLHAEVAEIAATSPALTQTRLIVLESAQTIDGGDRAAGVPNYLTSIAVSPDGTRAAVASKQDNTQRGLLFGVGDLTHETSVRAVVSFVDLVSNNEIRHSRRDFDNADSPSALAYTPLGDTLLVTLQGNNRVIGMDATGIAPLAELNTTGSTFTSPVMVAMDLGTGLAPHGVLIDPVSARLFTQDFMGRTVTVRDATPLLAENRTALPVVAMTPTVAHEPLSPEVLLGKRIFYNAADPRMGADGYISCASCHLDGGHDGRVWDFTGRGEGLRRTTDLRGRSGLAHGNVHWSANFDEIQDFEHDIRGPFGGSGFLPLTPQEFAALHPSPASGKTGLSPELDALAAYVTSLIPATTPRSPHRNTDGTLTAAALRGRAVFEAESCSTCHSDPALTDSLAGSVSTRQLHDVGTLSSLSGLRLHDPLEGIDTPTLHGLHATRTFLHHGLAPTLAEVFSYAAGQVRRASEAELVNLPPNANSTDNPLEGGGGSTRGVVGGSFVHISDASPGGLIRFTAIDGGLSGGPARIALRYACNYGGGTALVRVNGVEQTITVFRQFPDNGFMTSGWLWVTLDATLLAGPTNTIELLRGSRDISFNIVVVANADDLAAAHPHRRALSRSSGDRDDLIAYLRSLDYRNDQGIPLSAPAPSTAVAPTIIAAPDSQTLAIGNTLALHVAVGGTGPFTYQWRRGTALVGTDSPILEIPSITLAEAGAYTVTVTNAAGQITSAAAQVIINPALSVTPTSIPVFTVGRTYNHTLAATGGIDTRTWTLASGALPNGLTLTPDGRIQGTPVAPARATFTVRVADSSGHATRELSLDVRPVGGFVNDLDLILHYTFDEGSGARIWDSSPAGNDHTTVLPSIPAGFPINRTPTWSANGRFGGAYGTSDLAGELAPFFPANQGDLDFAPHGDAFTVAVWVRTTATTSYRTLLSKNGHADENWTAQYRLWTSNHSPTSLQGITGGAPGSMSQPTLNDGQWHLVTLVNDYDTTAGLWRTRLYFDGGATHSEWNTGNGGRTLRLLAIGDTSNGYNSWIGQLDDLRIYRRALTPQEITALYNAPATPPSYDAWLATLPTPLPPGLRAPTDDADNDGVPNLLEYALGGDPMNAASAPAAALTHHGTTLSLSYLRARPDLDYTVETSTTLAPGSWTTTGVVQDTTTPVGLQATATVPMGPEAPRRFLRLRVNER